MKKHALIWFFILAYGLSWIVEIPLALQSNRIIRKIIPYSFHYLVGYGPLVASLVVTGFSDGAEGLKDLWQRMTKWKVEPVWWLVAVSPLCIYLLVGTVLWLIHGEKPDLISLGQVDHLPPLGLGAIPLWILTFGLGEEVGWRGFALPRLQNGHKALTATILLWVFWALWHLPLFFYSYDFSIVPGMLIGLLAGAIIFTWLYNSTGGSVLISAIWHGLFNYTTACISCKVGSIAAIISTLVMVWSVVVLFLFKSINLSRSERQII